MHSKQKGNIGQLAVGTKLAQLGYSVFTEQGDLSKIDIIAEKDGKLLRIQCKCITPIKGVLRLYTKKSGPNYEFRYTKDQFDYFAAVNIETLDVYLIASEIVEKNRACLHLRLDDRKYKHSQYANNYKIEKILGS